MSAEIYRAIYESVLSNGSKIPGLCCVCLQAMGADMICIHDEIQFNLSTTIIVEKITYILETLIGKSFSDISSIYDRICHLCKEATISSYSFILSTRERTKVLSTAIEDLEKCFTDIPQSIMSNCKTLFVELDLNDVEKSTIIKCYYDTVSINSKTEGFERMRLIIEDQNNMTDIHAFDDADPNLSNLENNQDESNSEVVRECQLEPEGSPNLLQEKILTQIAKVRSAKCLKPYNCPDCEAGFNCLERYNNHRNQKKKCSSRGRGHYSCDQCTFTAVYKSLIHRHIRFQHNNPTLVCQCCGKTCTSQSELKLHKLKHCDEKKFECQECGGKFKTKSSLQNHMTIHTGERNYPCDFCDQSFRNASNRNEHTRRHHIQNPVQCDICQKVYKVKEDLLRHLKSHSSDEKGKYPCSECTHRAYTKKDLEQHFNFKHRGERPFECETCGKSFGTQKLLKIHMSTHKDKTYDCKECSQSFKSLFGFKSHMFNHTGEKPYPCEYCDQTFKDSNRRLDHVRRHHIFEPHECDICKKVYRTQPDLLRHKKGHLDAKGKFPCSECEHRARTKRELEEHFNFRHRGERPFKCETCDKSYGTKNSLLIHMSIHKNKTYDCKECSQSFKSLFGLKSHMFIHTGEKPYPCEYCDQTFKDSARRLDHVRRHHIFEPHECDICKKVYRTQPDLLRHKKGHLDSKGKFPCSECEHRAHTKKDLEEHFNFKHRGERPFKCETCGKCYGTRKTFLIHKATHRNKTYDCKECSQSFKSLFGFKSHMFIHTGEKPYPCKYCDKTFKDSNRRLDHVRRHHVFEPHECDMCQKIYRTQGDLYRHRRKHLDRWKEKAKATDSESESAASDVSELDCNQYEKEFKKYLKKI